MYSILFFFWLNRLKKIQYIKVNKVLKIKPTFGVCFKRVWLERSRFGLLPVQAPLSGCLCHENQLFSNCSTHSNI